MSIRQLTENEIEDVSGGALSTRFVKTNVSLRSLSLKGNTGSSVASVCQCVNCCSNHIIFDKPDMVTPK